MKKTRQRQVLNDNLEDGGKPMKRKIAHLGKKTGLDDNEVTGFLKIGLSGLVALALSVFAGSVHAGGSDPADLQKSIDKPRANQKLAERCKLKPEGGRCKALFWKYYFNQETKSCETFAYGGCDGVVPFETKEECQKACLDQKAEPVVNDENCGPYPGYPCGTRYFTVSLRDFRLHVS